MAKPPNDKIDEAVAAARESIVPLLIRRRCTPHQQATWIAISFLLRTHPRADFGLREIAQEIGTKSYPRVSGWIDELVELGLLDREVPIASEQEAEKRNNFPLIRSKYAIPWKTILEESLTLADEYVRRHVRGGDRLRSPSASIRAEQQSFFGAHVTEGSHEGVTEGSHEGVTDRSHEGVTDRSQSCYRSITVSCDPSVTDGWMDGMDDSRMDGESRANKKQRSPGRPPNIPPPPPPELFATHPGWMSSGPLPTHPRDLWRNACATSTAAHDDKLAALAAEHDGSTDGHGWYFVGRAILSGTDAHDQLSSPTYIRNTLIRWRAEDSYGSDKARPAKEPSDDRRSRPADRPARPVEQSGRPTEAAGSGPPPGLKIYGAPRPAAPAPDSGEPPPVSPMRD